MRTFTLIIATVVGILLLPAASGGIAPSTSMGSGTVLLAAHSVEAQEVPVINVEINKGGGKAWYANPVWMAIGGLALLVLIVLLVMAFKGGGTTVVKA
jgi:hypothetical protein